MWTNLIYGASIFAGALAADWAWCNYRVWRSHRQAVKAAPTLTRKYGLPWAQ